MSTVCKIPVVTYPEVLQTVMKPSKTQRALSQSARLLNTERGFSGCINQVSISTASESICEWGSILNNNGNNYPKSIPGLFLGLGVIRGPKNEKRANGSYSGTRIVPLYCQSEKVGRWFTEIGAWRETSSNFKFGRLCLNSSKFHVFPTLVSKPGTQDALPQLLEGFKTPQRQS